LPVISNQVILAGLGMGQTPIGEVAVGSKSILMIEMMHGQA
jgi:hypothetical protein